MKASFFAHNERAREIITALLPFARHLEPMLQLDGITVTVEKYRSKRSSDQNRRYWAILSALGNHVGLSSEEMHEECLCEHFGYEQVYWRGSIRKKPLCRSSKLTTVEFSALMSVAERWAVEEGVMWEEAA